MNVLELDKVLQTAPENTSVYAYLPDSSYNVIGVDGANLILGVTDFALTAGQLRTRMLNLRNTDELNAIDYTVDAEPIYGTVTAHTLNNNEDGDPPDVMAIIHLTY